MSLTTYCCTRVNMMNTFISQPTVLKENYNVQRIIWRRPNQERQGYQYLVEWKGYQKADSTWEPEIRLPQSVVEGYFAGNVNVFRQEAFVSAFERAVQARLKTKNPKSFLFVELDVYRALFGDIPKLCELEDFEGLGLSMNWYYLLSNDGSGRKLKFPIKLTPELMMRKMYVKEAGRLVIKIVPVEKCNIFSCTEACTLADL